MRGDVLAARPSDRPSANGVGQRASVARAMRTYHRCTYPHGDVDEHPTIAIAPRQRIMTLDALRGLRVAVTGGTSGLGLALVARCAARGARVAFVARDADARRSASRARSPARTGSSATSRARTTSTRRAADRRRRSAASTCSSTTRRASVRCRSRCSPTPSARTSSAALATNVLGPFRLTKALLGALAASAREGRGARRRQRLERRGGQRLRRLGRLRREQGRAAAPERASGTRSSRRTACASSPSTRATWTRRCTRWRCPTPIARR